MKLKANKLLCPPDNSLKLFFQIPLNVILNYKLSIKLSFFTCSILLLFVVIM